MPTQLFNGYGDFVADEFQYGEITRVSREAPVLILRHRETHFVPGGGANAANNLAALGARVSPVTAVGDDAGALAAYEREVAVEPGRSSDARERIARVRQRAGGHGSGNSPDPGSAWQSRGDSR